MAGVDIDLVGVWRRTLVTLDASGLTASERAFVGLAHLVAVVGQNALVTVPNDYTKTIVETRVHDHSGAGPQR